MSSEIFYDKAFIRVGEQFIPVVNHGASNCFDFDSRGREISEKHWTVLNYTFRNRQIFNVEEMQRIAAVYEEASSSNRGGTRKSRYRPFEEGEFGRWILAGMKSAHTVEEYTRYGNTVIVIDYSEPLWKRYCVSTTEELLKKLTELEGREISVSFWNDRRVAHPPRQRKGQPTDFSKLPKFYVLCSEHGYYVKRSRRRIWFAKSAVSNLAPPHRFKSEKEAKRYLSDNWERLSKYAFVVECVENGGASV